MSNALISVLTLPNGTSYDIKDAWARSAIAELEAYTDYLGVTTTALTDGATTNPIIINEESVTAKKGNIVNYGSKEFIFNGTAWQEFGDLSGLGDLAYKDDASATYTPAGTIENTPSTTSIAGITSVGTLPTVSPTTDTVYSITDVGTLPTVSPTTDNVYSITDVGTLPVVDPTTTTVNSITDVGTLPTFTYDSNSESLTFGAGTLPTKGANQTVVSDVGYTAGTLPTKGTAVSVVTSVGYTAGTLPTKGAAQTVVSDVGYTAGTLPQMGTATDVLTGVTSVFTGTEATITVS